MEHENIRGSKVSNVPGEDGDHITYCRICESLCGMVATVRDGKIEKIRPDHDNPHSQGHICVKGPAMAELTEDPDRIIYPMKRIGGVGEFERASWDEAIRDIAERLNALIEEHGPDSFAVNYGNPSAFGIASTFCHSMFHQVVGSSKNYSPHSEDSGAPLMAHLMLFGSVTLAFPDLENCDYLMIFGSNPLVSHGSLIIAPTMRKELDEIAKRGEVIVVDPRRTATAAKFEHQPINPDSDAWLLAAMVNTIVENDLTDDRFLDQYSKSAERLFSALRPITPESAEPRCGIAADRIREMALEFASTKRAAAMARTGICRGSFATLSNFLLNTLNIVAGKFHKKGCSGFSYGANDTGEIFTATGMVGYVPNASRTSNLPQVSGSMPSVTLADDIMMPGAGQVKGLLSLASNPVMSMPGGPKIAEAFKQLDLYVSLDLYMTESNRHADYILPATTALERDDLPLFFTGHMMRPYIQYTHAVLPPKGEARKEYDILKAIAEAMGNTEIFAAEDSMQIADAILQAGPEGPDAGEDSLGLSVEMLKSYPHGVMLEKGRWNFKLEDKLRHPDGKIDLFPELIADEVERLKSTAAKTNGKLRLISSRKLRSINSWMHNVEKLVRKDRPTLLINPEDARQHNIGDGSIVILSTDWGEISVEAEVTDEMIAGCVTYPHGWGHNGGWETANATPGQNINAITPSTPESVEQITGVSFLDGFEVELKAVG